VLEKMLLKRLLVLLQDIYLGAAIPYGEILEKERQALILILQEELRARKNVSSSSNSR